MGLLKSAGAMISNIRQPKYAPLFVERTIKGLYTQRAVFHDSSDVITSKFYGGAPDTLYNGTNVELSNDLTLIRAYGTSAWTTATYPTAPLRAYSFELTNGTIQALIDTESAIYIDNQNGTKTLLYTKSATAGQSYFLGVGGGYNGVCYIGDGTDLIKYVPGNPNGTIWNWGITAPTAPPTVTTVESGTSGAQWVASTVFSTMGLIEDGNNNVQQLYSVNAIGDNTTQLGTTGFGAPSLSTTINSTSTDGTVTWTCYAQIALWQPNHVYSNAASNVIYDPTSNALYFVKVGGTSGSQKPTFNSAPIYMANTTDGSVTWSPFGSVNVSPTVVETWQKDTAFNKIGTLNTNAAIAYPLIPYVDAQGQLCGGRSTFLLAATTAGTTANTSYTPWTSIPSQVAGDTTTDNELIWVCQGPAAWAANTAYIQWTLGVTTFGVIKDSNGNMQVCVTSGTSAGSQPTWGTGYGTTTTDGTVIWTCVGPPVTWQTDTQWYLPPAPFGFSPPTPAQPYGSANVIGSNFVQYVVATTGVGTSGSSTPSWSVTVGNTTTDNDVTWKTVSAFNPNSLSWTSGFAYAYSYKCRTSTDYYVNNIPPGLTIVNGPPTGGATGAISTASPATTITGANSGAVNIISGPLPNDPQVDTIVIWRSADGGGSSNMFELTEFPVPKTAGVTSGSSSQVSKGTLNNGLSQHVFSPTSTTWQFTDYLPSLPTSTFPGLNTLVPAPIDDSNNPPPAGFVPHAWHFQRIFGPVTTSVYFSGGPDVIVGNPNEAFNPADVFPFLSGVTRCIHTPTGLVTVLQNDIEAIYGGPTTSSFYSTTLFPGKGALSFNAIDWLGGEIYMFTSDSQFLMLTPSLQVSHTGFPIGNKLAAFDAADVYLTVHDEGTDNAVYISDGSTGFYRLNPHQVPQGDAIWSPFRTVTGGCGLLQSVVTAPGVSTLLIGGTGTNQNILERNQSVFSDSGTAYESNFEIGAITLADPGQTALVKFIECDFAGTGTVPTLSVALDDPTASPTWTQLTTTANDPPQVYGQTVSPPYYPVRYYLPPNLAVCRHIRLKVDYGNTDTVGNELYGFAIFGKLQQEA
jgi:hypothetical protein